MVKYIPILFLLFVVGCGSSPVVTEVQQQFVPVHYCPTPPIVDRPDLYIFKITNETSDGDVVKMYKATVLQLMNYSSELETILNSYNNDDKPLIFSTDLPVK